MSQLLHSRLISFCLVTLLALTASAFASTVDEVAKANSHLKRAEANLALVDGSIGHLTKPPKGSAAKLAKMRLEQALGDMEAARKALEGASGAEADKATKRHNDAVTLYNKLRTILTGEEPKPEPEPEPTPDEGDGDDPPKEEEEKPKTIKLGYPHADNFKNALFTLRRVEGDTATIVKLLEELRPVEDQLSINYRKAAQAMAHITETRRQGGFAEDALAKIPSNGEGVAEAKQRLVNARASLDVAHAYFRPLDAKLRDLVNPANYPEFQTDLKRLRELASAYANAPYLFREQRTRAAEAFRQGDAAKAECIRVAKAYSRLMEQETDQGKQIEIAGNNFLANHGDFFATAAEQGQSLPQSIREDLAEADRMANEAVEKQMPAWFSGGIPQRMAWVEDKLTLYEVIDPKGADALVQEVDKFKASLAKRAHSLRELIIRENPLPADRFEGADRKAAVAIAMDAWKIQESDYELLAVRIPSEAWSRETKWTYSNGTWYFVDRSTLQVRLIVADKDNPEQAIDRPINVRKDHQKGDTMIGVPMRSFDEELQPSEYLLRNKIK